MPPAEQGELLRDRLAMAETFRLQRVHDWLALAA
jgi:hypothetical protein